MLKPWLDATGDDPHYSEPAVIRHLAQMLRYDHEVTIRVFELGFLDTIELEDPGLLEYFLDLLTSDPEGLRQLLEHPELSVDSVDTERRPIPLLYLESKDRESAESIEALPWVQDGMQGFEIWSVMHLADLALVSQQVFHALLERELNWLPPDPDSWAHGDALDSIVSISESDEGAALMILDMPFLKTLDHAGFEALRLLADLAASDSRQLRHLLSHNVLSGGPEENPGVAVALLDLRRRDAEAADQIEALAWVQNGIGKPAYENVSLANPDPAEYEQGVVLDLINLAAQSRDVFTALVSKPWMQDSLNQSENEVVDGIVGIAARGSEHALKLLGMPFLETIERDDDWMLEIVVELARYDPNAVETLLSHPELKGGIEDGQVAVLNGVSLEIRDPEAASAINALSWVSDGISPAEDNGLIHLQFAALQSSQIFLVLMEKPWVQDGLNENESSTIGHLLVLSSVLPTDRAETVVLGLLAMPFLESVDRVDAVAMDSLNALYFEEDGVHLHQTLTHPFLQDGITDDKAVVVSVLSMVARERPELLDVLLDPELTTVEKRVVSLPLAGDVILAVVSVEAGAAGHLDLFERIVRIQEEIMGVPFPRQYAALLVAEASRFGGQGSSRGIITVDPSLVEGSGVLAHEIAHIYWSYGNVWISEGGAELIREITQIKMSGRALIPFEASCSLAGNIGDLERLAFDLTTVDSVSASETIYWSGCMYTLGLGLFMELYQELGTETFRQGFGSLYLKLEAEEHSECTGLERGLCYVRAAFVDDAPPKAAAVAEEIIHKWYYGNPIP